MSKNIPIPTNESERLKALQSYEILDTEKEQEFDRLTELASIICQVPIALVSLIDKERQWFKSNLGLEVNETPREISFCQFAIMGENIFEIDDAKQDERFKNNPLVTGSPDIRFYAGYPLLDPSGFALGTLCVIDRKPKKLTDVQQRALAILGKEVVSQITARKERKDLYDFIMLFNSSVDLVCVANTNGFFKRINPAFTRILGWSETELLDKPFTNYIHPEDIEETKNQIQKLAEGYNVIDFINRFRTKTGDYIMLDWVANPDPKTGNLYAIARDVTELKRKEIEFHNLTKFQSTILNGTEYSIIATNPDGIISIFNKGAELLLGYKAQEMIGINSPAIFHDPEEVLQRAKLLSKELNQKINSGFETFVAKSRLGVPDVNEWTYIRKDGTRIQVILSVTTLKNEKNEITGYLGIARDITERKISELKLKESEERHRMFFENTQGLMCTHDRFGKFLSINHAGANLIGYTPEELLTKSLFDITPKSVKEKIQLYLEDIFNSGKHEGLMKVLHKNGETRIWYYKNTIIKDSNSEEIAIGNALDFTEHLAVEHELKEAKILAEKSVLAKDQFLANMSHEIRTPMNAILGFTDILMSTSLTSEQQEYLSAISNSGENLMVIINDILDFSKIEAGKLNLENEPIRLKDVINSVKQLLNHKAIEKNLKFKCFVENDIPSWVIGDKVRLGQILVNLVGNAIKFTEKGSIELFVNQLSNDGEKCTIEFKIKDSGIGILKEKQPLIFERFIQADDNTTRKYGGTGLGLSITQRLTKLFGGTLELESELGKGSTFIVKIPFNITTNESSDLLILNNENTISEPISILLAEDNILNQKLAKHIIESNGINLEIVSNGQEAIDILKEKSFDLILMDLQMPIMDGYVATSCIRNIMKLETPIIAMTAHSLVGEKEKCLSFGMNDYLSKPYKAAELLNKIQINTKIKMSANKQNQLLNKIESNLNYSLSDIKELSNNDPRFVKEMISIFLKEIPKELIRLKEFYNTKNLIGFQKLGHKIKSTYMMFMANRAIKICETIESTKNFDNMDILIEELDKISSNIMEDLKLTDQK